MTQPPYPPQGAGEPELPPSPLTDPSQQPQYQAPWQSPGAPPQPGYGYAPGPQQGYDQQPYPQQPVYGYPPSPEQTYQQQSPAEPYSQAPYPQQPYPEQPYAQQPFAQQYQAGPPADMMPPQQPGYPAFAPPPVDPGPPHHGRKWVWISLAVVVLVLAVGGGVGYAVWGRGDKNTSHDTAAAKPTATATAPSAALEPAPAQQPQSTDDPAGSTTVSFDVTVTGGTPGATYYISYVTSSSSASDPDATVPWHKEIADTGSVHLYFLDASNFKSDNKGATLTCTIRQGSKILDTKSATGAFASVNCRSGV